MLSPLSIFPAVSGPQKAIYGNWSLLTGAGHRVSLAVFPVIDQDCKQDQIKQEYNIDYIDLSLVTDKDRREIRRNNFLDKKIINFLTQYVLDHDIEVLWVEYSRLSLLASNIVRKLKKDNKRLRIIIRAINFEFFHAIEQYWMSLADDFRNIKLLIRHLKRLINVFMQEWTMVRIADIICNISKYDISLYPSFYRKKQIYLPFYSGENFDMHLPRTGVEQINVFYMGSDYANNVSRSGAEYIIKELIGICEKRDLPVRFHIIGKNPTMLMSDTHSPHLTVHGFVPDLDVCLHEMDAAIYPIKHGYGLKTRIYESICRGFPTIGFANAFRGINEISGKHFFIVKNAEEFIARVLEFIPYERRKEFYEVISPISKKLQTTPVKIINQILNENENQH